MREDLDRYFRAEARELLDGLTRGLLDLEKDPGRSDLIAQCFRLAHTLKGAARTVRRVHIGELAHAIEDALAPFRDGAEVPAADFVTDLLKLLDLIRSELGSGDAGAGRTGEARDRAAAPDGHEERLETVRVDLAAMDALLDGLSEARVQLSPLQSGVDALASARHLAHLLVEELRPGRRRASTDPDAPATGRARAVLDELCAALAHAHRDVGSSLGRIQRELEQAFAKASALRLVPVSAIFGSLELGVRDAAQSLEKPVELEVSGGDVRLEGHILSAVRAALLHVVRNAVDHGIEPADERVAAGKPRTGRIQLRIERRGRRVAFLCEDDGRGIDTSAVRRSAISSGIVPLEEAEALSPDAARMLIFRAGVTTSEAVTEVSGRGVGLDVVREIAQRFKGDVHVSSEPGRGTTIGLEVPVSMSSLAVLIALVGRRTVLIPLDAVRATLRISANELTPGQTGAAVLHEGEVVPFSPLASFFEEGAGASPADGRWSLIVVESHGRKRALGVDRLLGTTEITIKALPPAVGASPAVAGAAFDAQGEPLLVLDPRGLVGLGHAAASSLVDAASDRPPILVIDDSLTTRMLEQSILESAGYDVDLAASGEQGLRRARERRYGLFILDIEMPGMNGFEFTALAHADSALRDVPILMVTSLASPEHRRRGFEAGARAYIVKGEFDQKYFLRKVAELLA
jgi:two-component system chemotaxis sensor kinase CheA